MTLDEALAMVKAAGYRVTKPKERKRVTGLNAIGRPYSENYDPNYRMKYKAGSTAHLFKPYGRLSNYLTR